MAAINNPKFRPKKAKSMKRSRSRSHPPAVAKQAEPDPPPLLPAGYVLRNRWRVDAQLAKGAFGEVCVAYDLVANRTVAIKSERLDAKTAFLSMDVDVLRKLQEKTAVPRFYACGHTEQVNYVVMQLLGRSVLELKKATPDDRFSYGTAIRIIEQMTCCCRDLHESGFLHRDIKPANFTIGPPVDDPEFPYQSRIIYMIDFGLCRSYIDPNTGKLYSPRSKTGFRGTPRYSSINCLKGFDVGRCDDLWSLFYVLVEFMVGQLPWRRMNEKKEILECKLQWPPAELLPVNGPIELRDIVTHLADLDFHSTPNYAQIQKICRCALDRLKVNYSTPWDWDQWSTPQKDYEGPMQKNSAGSEASCVANGSHCVREKFAVEM